MNKPRKEHPFGALFRYKTVLSAVPPMALWLMLWRAMRSSGQAARAVLVQTVPQIHGALGQVVHNLVLGIAVPVSHGHAVAVQMAVVIDALMGRFTNRAQNPSAHGQHLGVVDAAAIVVQCLHDRQTDEAVIGCVGGGQVAAPGHVGCTGIAGDGDTLPCGLADGAVVAAPVQFHGLGQEPA